MMILVMKHVLYMYSESMLNRMCRKVGINEGDVKCVSLIEMRESMVKGWKK